LEHWRGRAKELPTQNRSERASIAIKEGFVNVAREKKGRKRHTALTKGGQWRGGGSTESRKVGGTLFKCPSMDGHRRAVLLDASGEPLKDPREGRPLSILNMGSVSSVLTVL